MKAIINRTTLIALCAATASMACAQVVLTPGNTTTAPQLGNANYPGQLLDFSSQSFTGFNALMTPVFTGTLDSYVFADSSSNKLDFAWIISNDSTSKDQIDSLSVTGYSGFSTSVAQGKILASTSADSFLVQRSANGNTVDFSWISSKFLGLSAILPGTSSSPQIIYTDATKFGLGTANIQDGGIATVRTFAPQAVPEPTSIFALALGAVGLLRRKSK